MFRDSADAVGTVPVKRSRGRPKVMSDADQQVHIVEIGRTLFLERGFARTTMDEVVNRARVSKKTLYRLFASKLELFAAVVEAERHAMLAFPPEVERLGLVEALRTIVRIDIGPDEDRERHGLLRMAFFESFAHPELREAVFVHGVEKSRLEFAGWLRRRVAAGELAVDDPDLMARFLMDLVFGASRPPVCSDEVEDPAERRYRIEKCIELYLRGLLPRS